MPMNISVMNRRGFRNPIRNLGGQRCAVLHAWAASRPMVESNRGSHTHLERVSQRGMRFCVLPMAAYILVLELARKGRFETESLNGTRASSAQEYKETRDTQNCVEMTRRGKPRFASIVLFKIFLIRACFSKQEGLTLPPFHRSVRGCGNAGKSDHQGSSDVLATTARRASWMTAASMMPTAAMLLMASSHPRAIFHPRPNCTLMNAIITPVRPPTRVGVT